MAPSPAEVEGGGQRLKGLKDIELKMAAEIATEIAKGRSGSFNVRATALMLCRAALVDQAFRARLAEVHRRLEIRRASKEPPRLLAPITPLFRDLERDAARILDPH
jgi:hypothetical protein